MSLQQLLGTQELNVTGRDVVGFKDHINFFSIHFSLPVEGSASANRSFGREAGNRYTVNWDVLHKVVTMRGNATTCTSVNDCKLGRRRQEGGTSEGLPRREEAACSRQKGRREACKRTRIIRRQRRRINCLITKSSEERPMSRITNQARIP